MKKATFENKLAGGLFYTILGLCYGVLRLVFEGDPQLLALVTFATLICFMAGGYHFGLAVKTHLRDKGLGSVKVKRISAIVGTLLLFLLASTPGASAQSLTASL